MNPEQKDNDFDICKEMDFSFKQCETFCRIVELGSFSKAAEELNITQASASERVANLEKIVGVQLLDRLGRNIVLSSAGKVLYERVSKLLTYRKQACQELNDFLGVRRGEVTLGGSTIPGEFILPEKICAFRKEFPEIHVKLLIGDTGSITRKTLDGEVEIAIVGSKEKNPLSFYQKLWADEIQLAVPAQHEWASRKSITIDDLKKEPFIMREAGSGTRRILEKALHDTAKIDLNCLNIVAYIGSSTGIKEAIKCGLGVSFISKWALQDEIKNDLISVVAVENLKIKRNFYMMLDRRRAQSPLCQALKKFILKSVDN